MLVRSGHLVKSNSSKMKRHMLFKLKAYIEKHAAYFLSVNMHFKYVINWTVIQILQYLQIAIKH